ncbi:uncharacterized protein LOC108596235 [Drosophila busckii]|uniref:uncharacterized protein LOC108596235 n=1 Tax=Drosophila busckii TaxID=30019 RepID=UPI00083EDD38|nr:uncharacterized protein LOC108596235 [Drosophila busckii]
MERSHSCSNFVGPAESTETTTAASVAANCNSSENLAANFPPNKPLRKRRKLQRQQSIILDDVADPPISNEPLRLSHCECSFDVQLEQHDDCRCRLRHEESFDSAPGEQLSPQSIRLQRFSTLLLRDSSVSMQSDSSRYSSVDSLLESRKPDPEAILINLGFGSAGTDDLLSRIPKRFLKPSMVPGIDTDAFVKRLQLARSLADSSALGYRGLTSSSDQPPSSIVAKIMERFEVNNQRKNSMGHIAHTIR